MIDIKIVLHFDKKYGTGGDYYDVEVVLSNKVVLASYGDEYHEKGWDRAVGFIDGFLSARELPRMHESDIPYEQVADREV